MVKRPKLLVILGAGSSIPCGMPSVGEIDELMKHWSQEWAAEQSDFNSDVFNLLWTLSERYQGTNHYGIRPNYEDVLGEMTSLASARDLPIFKQLVLPAQSTRMSGEHRCLMHECAVVAYTPDCARKQYGSGGG